MSTFGGTKPRFRLNRIIPWRIAGSSTAARRLNNPVGGVGVLHRFRGGIRTGRRRWTLAAVSRSWNKEYGHHPMLGNLLVHTPGLTSGGMSKGRTPMTRTNFLLSLTATERGISARTYRKSRSSFRQTRSCRRSENPRPCFSERGPPCRQSPKHVPLRERGMSPRRMALSKGLRAYHRASFNHSGSDGGGDPRGRSSSEGARQARFRFTAPGVPTRGSTALGGGWGDP